jgi:hypothetical protein
MRIERISCGCRRLQKSNSKLKRWRLLLLAVAIFLGHGGRASASFRGSSKVSALPSRTGAFLAAAIQSPNGPTAAGAGNTNDVPAIGQVRQEAEVYARQYGRYNLFYWLFSLCATGTAISTVIRAGYTSTLPAPTAPTSNPENVTTTLKSRALDHWILGLAIATTVSTTLQSVVQPHETAERYRIGQLTIEKALRRYDGIKGDKTQADVNAVTDAYANAEDVLQGGVQEIAQKMSTTSNK